METLSNNSMQVHSGAPSVEVRNPAPATPVSHHTDPVDCATQLIQRGASQESDTSHQRDTERNSAIHSAAQKGIPSPVILQ